ncbi:MAG: AAA-associated domain-containing protein [Caldisphaera sp.]|uniref:AAA-associated domain-containing protein n=1 Tax=Caldisphaera sp. TaxID=2060322 RepID=UPI00397A6EF5
MNRVMEQFPLVYVDQVIGLVKYINSIGGRVDSSRLDEMLDVDLDILPHVIKAAEMLGLIKQENGDLVLTEIGRKMEDIENKDLRIILKKINKNIEPFKDIIAEVKRNKITLEQLNKILEKNGYTNMDVAVPIITQWLALIGISVVYE